MDSGQRAGRRFLVSSMIQVLQGRSTDGGSGLRRQARCYSWHQQHMTAAAASLPLPCGSLQHWARVRLWRKRSRSTVRARLEPGRFRSRDGGRPSMVWPPLNPEPRHRAAPGGHAQAAPRLDVADVPVALEGDAAVLLEPGLDGHQVAPACGQGVTSLDQDMQVRIPIATT